MAGHDRRRVSVLMVCLGICRSPMAEAVLKHQAAARPGFGERVDLVVDSAGTGAYHAGDRADSRTIATCRKHNVPISCTARKVTAQDYADFDYIVAMDGSNLQTLVGRAPPRCRAHVALFGAYDPSLLSLTGEPGASAGRRPRAQSIDDPYYGGAGGFDACYEQCVAYARGLLDVIEGKAEPPASAV